MKEALTKIVETLDGIPGSQSGWDEIRAADDQYAEVGRMVQDLVEQVRSINPKSDESTQPTDEVERLRAIALNLHARIEKYTTAMKEIANQTTDFLVKHQINQILSGDE